MTKIADFFKRAVLVITVIIAVTGIVFIGIPFLVLFVVLIIVILAVTGNLENVDFSFINKENKRRQK